MTDENLPTIGQALGPPPADNGQSISAALGAPPAGGPTPSIFGRIFNSSATPQGSLLSDFGLGFKEGYGGGPSGLGPETEDWLRKNGVFNEQGAEQQATTEAFTKGQIWPLISAKVRRFNQELIEEPIKAGQAAVGVGMGVLGGLVGVAGGAAERTGIPQEVARLGGHQYRPGELAGEVFQGIQSEIASPTRAHLPPDTFEAPEISDARNAAINALSPDRAQYTTRDTIPAAKSMNVIGAVKNDEGLWKGTVEAPYPAPAPEIARQADAAAGVAAPLESEVAAPAPPVDLDAAARQAAPETFAKYDPLVTWKAFLRSEIGRYEADRISAETDNLNTQIKAIEDRFGGQIESLPQKEYEEYQQLIDRRDAVSDFAREQATPEISSARQELQQIDYQMRDLAPEISAAYRQASEAALPESPQVQTPPSPSVDAEPAVAQGILAAEEASPRASTQPSLSAPTGPQRPIADRVADQLSQAGRPIGESQAAGQIVQAYYEARADRFGGAKGSADDLFQAEAPAIKGGDVGGRKGGASGKTVLRDGRSTITLFAKADASTFLHETGHQWLDQLMRDAEDEKAPEDLKQDAAAARKFIGADETGPIKTRQHERFARAFERYFMEGRAPSQRLAGVFEQFKGWLNKIYGVVSNLGKPITPDIRDVFDRLLSKPSERASYIPETGKELADIHEADAEHTPPQHAAEAADNVRSEIDQAAAQNAPAASEVLNGPRRTEPTAGTGSQPGGGESPVGGSSGAPESPGSAATGPGRAPELATVSGGRGEAAAEGVGTQPAKQLGPAKPAATGKPAGPNAPFAKPDAGLIDKAGNIRLENITTPAKVDELLRQVSEENDGFIEARRGVVSDAQVMDLAASMGLKPSDLNVGRLRREFSAEKIWATRQLFIDTANEVYGKAEAAAEGDPKAIIAYSEARSRLTMVQRYLSAITAETGRGLRAFRDMNSALGQVKDVAQLVGEETESRTLFQIQNEAARIRRFKNPNQVNKHIRDLDKPGLGAMALEMFKNALISNPFTHMIYLEGNATAALIKAIPETAAEVAFGLAKEAATGKKIPDRATLDEVTAQVHSLFFGNRAGLKAAADAFRSGETTMLPGEAEAATTPFSNTKAIPNEILGVNTHLGDILRAPGERMVAPIHSYSRTMTYFQSIAQQAVRQAKSEGLTGNRYDMRVASLRDSPTKVMMETARDFANQVTLMSKGGDLTRRIRSLVNWNPKVWGLGPTKPIAFIDPFVTVTSNILEQSLVQRTPLGILSSQIRADLSGANGFAKQSEAVGKMTVGTGIALAAGGLTAEGILTPSGPSDPKEAAIWQAEHGMPHSIKIGEMSYDINKLGYIGQIMGVAADLYHIGDKVKRGETDQVASLTAEAFAKNLLDTSSMKGISDMMKALDESDRYGASYVRNLLSSAVPFSQLMGGIDRETDPYVREARTMLDTLKARIPGWSETLEPKLDIWGQPVPNREFAGLVARRLTDDPLNRELLAEGFFPSPPERKITGVQLSDRQYFEYKQLAGQMAHRILTPQVTSPLWQQMPILIRHDIVKSAIEGSRAMARARMKIGSIGSDNDIIAKALGNKRAQFDAQPKDEDDY